MKKETKTLNIPLQNKKKEIVYQQISGESYNDIFLIFEETFSDEAMKIGANYTKYKWNITHEPTGKKVLRAKTKQLAENFVKYVLQNTSEATQLSLKDNVFTNTASKDLQSAMKVHLQMFNNRTMESLYI